ncbi:hypothetical protein EON76_03665 [bacterium]|nr:MAG: hypothetical protein EON76_03665 [bacterium]
MESVVRRALTDEERERAISLAFSNAQQELLEDARCGTMEFEWGDVVQSIAKQGYRFHWTPRFTRQPMRFAEHVSARLGYEIQCRYRFYDGLDDQTPPTPQAHLFRTHVPPDVALRMIQRFEVELRAVVGADSSEFGTVAPPAS